MKLLKQHLKDNSGDLHMERVIVIAIAFVIGALLVAAVLYGVKTHFGAGIRDYIGDYLN